MTELEKRQRVIDRRCAWCWRELARFVSSTIADPNLPRDTRVQAIEIQTLMNSIRERQPIVSGGDDE